MAIRMTNVEMVLTVGEEIDATAASASTPPVAATARGSSPLAKPACSPTTRPSPFLSLAEVLAVEYGEDGSYVLGWRREFGLVTGYPWRLDLGRGPPCRADRLIECIELRVVATAKRHGVQVVLVGSASPSASSLHRGCRSARQGDLEEPVVEQ